MGEERKGDSSLYLSLIEKYFPDMLALARASHSFRVFFLLFFFFSSSTRKTSRDEKDREEGGRGERGEGRDIERGGREGGEEGEEERHAWIDQDRKNRRIVQR